MMRTKTQSTVRFGVRIRLLEDLHAGSGLASTWVDRPLARDHQGQPVIPDTHVKGVWRDVAVRLAAMAVPGFDNNLIDVWFGAAPKANRAGVRGALICPELRPDTTNPETIVWTQSARERFSRRPATDTLRTTEYLAAGTELAGFAFLTGLPEHFDLFRQLLRSVDRLGAGRSRGDGRIQLLACEQHELPDPGIAVLEDAPATGIRLLLQAEAPVRVPATGFPGNIIESSSRIPGRMLSGAISRALLDEEADPAVLFSGAIGIGDALPLSPVTPKKLDEDQISGLQVFPAPLEYRQPKPARHNIRALDLLPPWPDQHPSSSGLDRCVDLLNSRHKETDDQQQSLKRFHPESYIQSLSDGSWVLFRQNLELAMRNRRGSDAAGHQMDDALFSVEQIPSGTRFVADILPRPAPEDHWDAWCGALAERLLRTPLLRIGRGGSPVRVIAIGKVDSANAQSDPPGKEGFRLTLTSDAIIRNEWLGFHKRLTLKALCDAIGLGSVPTDLYADDISEYTVDRAFNAATGLPRPAFLALRRGSSIDIRGREAPALLEQLQQHRAIGERQHEGMGRFVLNLDQRLSTERMPTDSTLIPPRESRHETVAAFVHALSVPENSTLTGLSRSQWGRIRNALEALPHDAGSTDLRRIQKTLAEAADRTRGGKKLEGIAKADGLLDQLARKIDDDGWKLDDCRLGIRLVAAQAIRSAASAEAVEEEEAANT